MSKVLIDYFDSWRNVGEEKYLRILNNGARCGSKAGAFYF